MRSLSVSVSILLLSLNSAAWAVHTVAPGEVEADIADVTGEGGEGPFPPFNELDRNGDGRLDAEEVSQVEDLRQQFKAADVNQDGTLDQEEFSAFEVTEGVMPGLDEGAER